MTTTEQIQSLADLLAPKALIYGFNTEAEIRAFVFESLPLLSNEQRAQVVDEILAKQRTY